MNDKVIKMITEYKILEQGDRILVGLSGGADSVALLDFLWKNKEKYQIEVMACHINHQLRREESNRDQKFVEYICKKYNIELFILSVDVNSVALEQKLSIEECARNIRYGFFEELSEKYNCKIATAHTLSDSMETILFNLARGTGIKGLCGIPPVRGNIVRPLIYATRAEIESYIKENKLDYVMDSTNETDAYTRNKIRHHIIPILYEINENADMALLRMTEVLKSEDSFLDSLAKEKLVEICANGHFDKAVFLEFDKALKCRMLAVILKKSKISVSVDKIDLILSKITNNRDLIELKKNVYFRIEKNDFYIEQKPVLQQYFEHTILKETLQSSKKYEVLDGKTIEFDNLNCEQTKNLKKSNDCVLNNTIDYDKIYGNVLLRQRKDGDKIKIAKRGITKSIKKLFNEEKLSAEEKSKRIVIEDKLGIVYVEGFGCDERVISGEFTKNKILITILEDSKNGK